jgi:hypothetical protein
VRLRSSGGLELQDRGFVQIGRFDGETHATGKLAAALDELLLSRLRSLLALPEGDPWRADSSRR